MKECARLGRSKTKKCENVSEFASDFSRRLLCARDRHTPALSPRYPAAKAIWHACREGKSAKRLELLPPPVLFKAGMHDEDAVRSWQAGHKSRQVRRVFRGMLEVIYPGKPLIGAHPCGLQLAAHWTAEKPE